MKMKLLNFADENYSNYLKFKITDIENGDIVYSDKHIKDIEEASMKDMFPDEESREDFDWTMGE